MSFDFSALARTINGIAKESAKRVVAVHGRTEDWLNEKFIEAIVHEHVACVLTDYFANKFNPQAETDIDSLASLRTGTCPDCGNRKFWPGPRGGAAQNFECTQCGSRFNVTLVYEPPKGTAVFTERIPNTGEWSKDPPITWGR